VLQTDVNLETSKTKVDGAVRIDLLLQAAKARINGNQAISTSATRRIRLL
jgi:hypothetical protein